MYIVGDSSRSSDENFNNPYRLYKKIFFRRRESSRSHSSAKINFTQESRFFLFFTLAFSRSIFFVLFAKIMKFYNF